MNQERAICLAKEGFNLFEKNKFEESLAKYREAIVHIDMNHWATQDIYGEYAMASMSLGKQKEAITARYRALESSLNNDEEPSISVVISRHFLIDSLLECNKLDEAKDALGNWTNKECNGRWLLNFVAAKLYYKKKDHDQYIKFAEKAYLESPEKKWDSVADVKRTIEQHENNS